MERLLDPSTRARYLHLHSLALTRLDPLSRWCLTPGCETVLKGTSHSTADGGGKGTEMLVCGKCGEKMCFQCGTAWHPDQTCSEASTAALQAFLASTSSSGGASEEIKSCPSCREGLQRDEGCNFVRCPRCRSELCWLCLHPYTRYHFSWWNLRGCPLLHLESCAWAGDDRCCGCGCGRWMGKIKRTLLRMFLFLVYLLAFLLLLPFLLLLSPYLLYRFRADAPGRERRREMRERRKEMEKAQMERARVETMDGAIQKPVASPPVDSV